MEENNVNLREEMKKSIKTTSSLYMVFGVLQCLSALVILISLIALLNSSINSPLLILFYLGLLFLTIMMIVSLFKASSNGQAAVFSDNENSMAEFLKQTSKYWMYNGILLIFAVVMAVLMAYQGANFADSIKL
ncbi:MAG: hypothetical protein J6Z26_08405 [Bacteroidales bacterium]|nr:hypothetical protein [Bacteroidales bacterium]